MKTINHFTEAEIDVAFETAKRNQIPVLIDYWAPGCKGCKKMNDTTYQTSTSLVDINKYFVFVKYNITNRNIKNRISSSPVLWTPCFMVYSNDENEIRKTTGYLTPQQFQDEMELGRAMAYLRKAQRAEALNLLENIIYRAHNLIIRQEALYWAGVAAYFLNKRTADSLIPYWEKLINNYPDSYWAERADCLDVIL